MDLIKKYIHPDSFVPEHVYWSVAQESCAPSQDTAGNKNKNTDGGGQLQASLGDLERLPPELYKVTLEKLDIESLNNWRLVNKKAKDVFDNLIQHRDLLKYWPGLKKFILETRAQIALDKLYGVLTSSSCSESGCSAFAGWLNLITESRFCSYHIQRREVLPREQVADLTDYK